MVDEVRQATARVDVLDGAADGLRERHRTAAEHSYLGHLQHTATVSNTRQQLATHGNS